MGGRSPYNCCFVGCCFQNLIKTVHRMLVYFSSSFFSMIFVSIHVVHLYSSTNTSHWHKCKQPFLYQNLCQWLKNFLFLFSVLFYFALGFIKDPIKMKLWKNTWLSQKFCNILVSVNLWLFKMVPTGVGSVVVVGVLTCVLYVWFESLSRWTCNIQKLLL